MKVTISSKDPVEHVIAVVEALYGVRLQVVPDGAGPGPEHDVSQVDLPAEDSQGATKPRHG